MKFNKSLDWLKESEEDTDDVFSVDELDQVEGDEEEQINEVRYINPNNLDKYDPSEIEEVTTASGEKRYKRKSGGGSSAQGTKEKAAYTQQVKKPEPGETYAAGEDVFYGHVEDIDEETADKLQKAGMVNDRGEITIPAGTEMKYQGAQGGSDVYEVNGVQLDMSTDDMKLMGKESKKIEKGYDKGFANDIKSKYGKDAYDTMVRLANQNDAEMYPDNTKKLIMDDTGMDEKDVDKFIQMYTFSDNDNWFDRK